MRTSLRILVGPLVLVALLLLVSWAWLGDPWVDAPPRPLEEKLLTTLPTCPPGPFLSVNSRGRLGNKLCQYLTLWLLADEMPGGSVRVLPPMEQKLNRHFAGRRQMTPLSANCSAAIDWKNVTVAKRGTFGARLSAGESLWISGNPCLLSELYGRRDAALAELPWRENVTSEARRRLALAPAGTRTYIGVHVRRDDYGKWLSWRLDGHLVSPAYLRCALRHARGAYPRPVFLVASDDMPWCRANIAAADDVLFVGSKESEAYDMATLGLCNHSIVTYGTFGYMSAFLAGGDVIAPTGYSSVEYYLVDHLRTAGRNITLLRDAETC